MVRTIHIGIKERQSKHDLVFRYVDGSMALPCPVNTPSHLSQTHSNPPYGKIPVDTLVYYNNMSGLIHKVSPRSSFILHMVLERETT